MKKACIDLGSNMAQLLIIDEFGEEHNFCEVTALGDSTYRTKLLKQDSMLKTLEVLKIYKNKIQEFGIKLSEVFVYGTEACRNATNLEELSSKILELGYHFEVIPAAREALLGAKGALSILPRDKEFIVLDIGGASTELCQLDESNLKIKNFASLKIGTISFSDWVESNTLDIKLSEFERNHLEDTSFAENKNIVCARGAMTTIFNMLNDNFTELESNFHGSYVESSVIEKKLDEYTKLNLDLLVEKYPYVISRKKTLLGAFHLSKYLMKLIRPKRIYVSSRGLAYGALLK